MTPSGRDSLVNEEILEIKYLGMENPKARLLAM